MKNTLSILTEWFWRWSTKDETVFAAIVLWTLECLLKVDEKNWNFVIVHCTVHFGGGSAGKTMIKFVTFNHGFQTTQGESKSMTLEPWTVSWMRQVDMINIPWDYSSTKVNEIIPWSVVSLMLEVAQEVHNWMCWDVFSLIMADHCRDALTF